MERKFQLLAIAVAMGAASPAMAGCPAITGIGEGGQFPQIFELAEYQKTNSCKMTFTGNPVAAELNGKIAGNPELKALSERVPAEPLVVVPYNKVGQYGGILDGISKATESGTSDLLSVRHVNLVRFSDDLQTLVPNVASGWAWNDDYTQLTLNLRKGHKWSDGEPFTAEDVVFWYHNMVMDENIIKSPKERFLSDGKPMKVEALGSQTVRFSLNQPRPGLLSMFATDYAQPFQPKHLLSKFHPALNNEADKNAKAVGFESGYDVINFYYGQSDWKDVPSPLMKDGEAAQRLVKAGYTTVAPTLESHILVEETLEGRRLVANPYFFQVDTAGNQLPYINEISEIYIGDEDIQTAKMIAGEVDYKAQSVNLPAAPVLLENRAKGEYQVSLRPTIGMTTFAFNINDKNEEKRAVFNDVNFRRAMSVAINRDKINEIAFFNLGKPMQFTAFDPDTAGFVTKDIQQSWTQFNSKQAAELLDKAGVVDKDGDGFRDLPSGNKLELTIAFSTQGAPTKVVEMVASDWTEAGVKTDIKEVTSDEYRNSQSANDLSVMVWSKGQTLATLSVDTQELLPPYGSFFGLRNGLMWAKYLETDGKEGTRPPKTVAEMQALSSQFTQLNTGTDASNKLGAEIAQRVVDDLFFIGTVKAVAPIYSNQKLANFAVPKTSSYEYYRVYPYLPAQWSLSE